MVKPAEAAAAARYSTVAIILHWLIAALLIFEVGLGLRMGDAHGPAKFAIFQLHKSVGITILLLAVLRLGWRWFRKPPAMGVSGWQRLLAQSVHVLFYALLLALPLSGWLIVSSSKILIPTLLYGSIPWPHLPGFANMAAAAKDMWHSAGEITHVTLVKLLYGLFGLHVLGALKHYFFDRESDLARMAPGVQPGRLFDPRLIAIGLGVVLMAALGRQLLPVGPNGQATPAAVIALPASGQASSQASSQAEIDPVPSDTATPTPEASAAASAAASPGTADQALSSWTITQGSSLHFRTTWSGAPINGGFNRFDGDIVFSPDHLDQSHVEIRVSTASIFSGDSQRDESLKGADWFSVSSSGTAVFKTKSFRVTGKDHYVASGTLTLKGVTLPISLPFTLRIDGDRAVMQGSALIDRTAYKIGEGEFTATDEIPAAVSLAIAIRARKK